MAENTEPKEVTEPDNGVKNTLPKRSLNKTKILTYSAVLSALGMVIVTFMPTINIVITSVTPASHVAVMLAMMIHPIVGVAVSVCTAFAFFLKGAPPEVVFRAFSHLVFVIPCALLAKKWLRAHMREKDAPLKTLTVKAGILNVITAVIHALAEICALMLAFLILDVWTAYKSVDVTAYNLFVIVGLITLAHSVVDFTLAYLIFLPLKRAGLTNLMER